MHIKKEYDSVKIKRIGIYSTKKNLGHKKQ